MGVTPLFRPRRQRVERYLRAKHGLTAQELQWLLEQQGGRCAGCGRPGISFFGPDGEPWQVDHDHAAAAAHPHDPTVGCRRCVRGLLCRQCNSCLGFARDSAETLLLLAEYVRRRSRS